MRLSTYHGPFSFLSDKFSLTTITFVGLVEYFDIRYWLPTILYNLFQFSKNNKPVIKSVNQAIMSVSP